MTDPNTDTTPDGENTVPAQVGEVLERAFGPGGIGDDDPDAAAKKKTSTSKKKPAVRAAEALGYYADLPELALAMSLTKVGDGLSTAMTVEGRRHELGENVIIITQAKVRAFKHEKLDDVDAWRVVEIYDGQRSTIVNLDDPAAGSLLKRLDKQDKASAKAEEEAAGVQTLDLGDDD